MKKILTVLILIAAICLLSAGTVFADTSTSQTFYIANENITVYVLSNNNYHPAFVIPKSYYFRTLSMEGEYSKIIYNHNIDYSLDLYITTSDLKSKAVITKDDVNDDNAYYSISLKFVELKNDNTTKFYAPESLSEYKTIGKLFEIKHILGAYQYDNCTYFTAIVSYNIANRPNDILMFKAIDTNNPSFTLASIPLHQITIDRNNAQNEGAITTPDDGNSGSTQNNVIRNVMIAVICILCVLVIFLIFRPTKNAKNRYEMENRENAEDNRYDNNGYSDRR